MRSSQVGRHVCAASMFILAAMLAACSGGGGQGAIGLPPGPTTAPSGGPTAPPPDDWITFAHDDQRTGFQGKLTGLSPSTVSNLALRWKITVSNGQPVYASPLVYGGNVIVVTEPAHGVIYDLSADTGAVLWMYQVAGEVRGTPTIDPVAGLLFVADRLIDSSGPLPSFLYAIHMNTGSLAWSRQLNGITHAGPVVAGGAVYQGTSGGDPPKCLNAGITALDELTGATKWTWYVNSRTNPGGGGSVWGPIAFDGSRLIFGTGNICGTTMVPTADGAAALDLSGNLLWSFVAQQNSYWDYDTGGAVMLSHGNASFKNKTGILYTVDAASGKLLQETTIDPHYGYGEFPSPSTDGSTTVIGYGLNPTSVSGSLPSLTRSQGEIATLEAKTHEDREVIERHTRRNPFEVLPGYYASLVALNSSGTVIWTHRMNSMLDGYAAIVNGVVFADNDSALSALDLRTGAQLWSYGFPSLPAASPVVVPSGVYAADGSGNVYAFALPRSTRALHNAVIRPQRVLKI